MQYRKFILPIMTFVIFAVFVFSMARAIAESAQEIAIKKVDAQHHNQ